MIFKNASLFIAASLACLAQTPPKPPAPPPSTVFTNPRSGADDPRVGLKAGLYDAAEAASGLERIMSLPKPPGFAPGDPVASPLPAPPAGEGRADVGVQRAGAASFIS